jgi:hypothetical protein
LRELAVCGAYMMGGASNVTPRADIAIVAATVPVPLVMPSIGANVVTMVRQNVDTLSVCESHLKSRVMY